jgi:hypothetical protein
MLKRNTDLFPFFNIYILFFIEKIIIWFYRNPQPRSEQQKKSSSYLVMLLYQDLTKMTGIIVVIFPERLYGSGVINYVPHKVK